MPHLPFYSSSSPSSLAVATGPRGFSAGGRQFAGALSDPPAGSTFQVYIALAFEYVARGVRHTWCEATVAFFEAIVNGIA